ncbi:MAG: YdcF family protein [Betaproteobacteria bacterium]
MSISWLITNLLAAMLLPPLNSLLLVVAGGWFWNRRPFLARTLAGSGALLLWVLALPVVSGAMLRSLEGEPVSPADFKKAQAIVVLGAGRYSDAPEYGGDTVGEATLLRLRYAAKLHRESGLPLLVTGGKPDGGQLSEAEVMRRVLESEFGIPVRWIEDASNNTRESAQYSAKIFESEGVSTVILVTHAWHMPRALQSFAETGLSALPAPTIFHRNSTSLLDFLPSGYGDSRIAMHEWIGLVWYRLRGVIR